jgi:acyl-coenzyme A synthetase/AMP-(fatty) acid ligase/acyl carrier protein
MQKESSHEFDTLLRNLLESYFSSNPMEQERIKSWFSCMICERILFCVWSCFGSRMFEFSLIENQNFRDFTIFVLSSFKMIKNREVTRMGKYVCEQMLLFAETESYRPMFEKLNVIFDGVYQSVFEYKNGNECHVDRVLNVRVSGFWHEVYFAEVEKLVLKIFDNTDFETQPDAICDMGCGDGTFLSKVYTWILRSKRGEKLNEYPILMIGADFSLESREETEKNLSKKGVPFMVLFGDVGDPKKLVADLEQRKVLSSKVLHIRSFLDHDRPFNHPGPRQGPPAFEDGVFIEKDGSLIDTNTVVQSLSEHLGRWSEALSNNPFGLIILEVHNLGIELTRKFVDVLVSFYFDITQSLSGQLLVTCETFRKCAAASGFSEQSCKIFPSHSVPRISLLQLVRTSEQEKFQSEKQRKNMKRAGLSGGSSQIADEVGSFLLNAVCSALQRAEDEISMSDTFVDLGLDSLELFEIANAVQKEFSLERAPSFFSHPSLKEYTDGVVKLCSSGGGFSQIADEVGSFLLNAVCSALQRAEDEISMSDTFVDLGLDSLELFEIANAVQKEFSLERAPSFFSHPSLKEYTDGVVKLCSSGGGFSQIADEVGSFLLNAVCSALQRAEDEISMSDTFVDLGLDSLELFEIANAVQKEFSLERAPSFFSHPSLKEYTDGVVKLCSSGGGFSQIADEVGSFLLNAVCSALQRAEDEISMSDTFVDLGLDSLELFEIANAVQKEFSLERAPSFFSHPSLKEYTDGVVKLCSSNIISMKSNVIIQLKQQVHSEKAVCYFQSTVEQEGLFVAWKANTCSSVFTVGIVLHHQVNFHIIKVLAFAHSLLRPIRFIESAPLLIEISTGFFLLSDFCSEKEAFLHPWNLTNCSHKWRIYAESDHFMVFFHHIIMDDWSIEIFDRDYSRLSKDLNGRLEVGLGSRFEDFATSSQLTWKSRAELKEWWTQHLSEGEAVDASLFGDVSQTLKASERCNVSFDWMSLFKTASRRFKVSTFQLLLVCFSWWLCRIHSRPVIVTTVFSHRSEQFADCFGCMVGLQVFYVNADCCNTWNAYLAIGVDAISSAQNHFGLSFAEVASCTPIDVESLKTVQCTISLRKPARRSFLSRGLNGSAACQMNFLAIMGGLTGGKISFEGLWNRFFCSAGSALNFVCSFAVSTFRCLVPNYSQKFSLFEDRQVEEWCVGPHCSVESSLFIFAGQRLFLGDIVRSRSDFSAVHCSRSVWQVSIEYSLCCSGVPFLPIPIDYTLETVVFRILDLQCSSVFTDLRCISALQQGSELLNFCIPSFEMIPTSVSNCANVMAPFYALHTSGSTGKPKGVIISRKNFLAFGIFLLTCKFQWTNYDRILFSTSIGFDISMVMRFWPVFQKGGSVVLMPQGQERDGNQIAKYTTLVSVLFLTPSQMEILALGVFHKNVRLAMSIGEPLSRHGLKVFFSRSDMVWNVYGPTEATVAISESDCTTDWMQQHERVSIGKPFPNAMMRVSIGQLFLHGFQISCGYVNRAKETRKAFPYDCHLNNGSLKMYNSGDRVLQSSSGDFFVEGRFDNQVKIRGFRVELGSVEVCSASFPGVQQAVCVLMDGNLVLGIVGSADLVQLKEYLSKKLVFYEIPSEILQLQELPLNHAGKLDRSSLFAIFKQGRQKEAVHEDVGQKMFSLEVLSCVQECLPNAQLEDAFWSSGGTSLVAMKLSRLLEARFGVSIGVFSIGRVGSFLDLAKIVEDQACQSNVILPEVLTFAEGQRSAKNRVHRTTMGQEAFFFLWKVQPNEIANTLPLSVEIDSKSDQFILRCLQELATVHQVLRTGGFGTIGKSPLFQFVQISSTIQFEVFDQDGKFCVWQELNHPWDLENGLVWRTRWVPEEFMVYFWFHHIIGDEWSMDLVQKDFVKLAKGQKILTPSFTFEDFSDFEHDYLLSHRSKDELWWEEYLRGTSVSDIGVGDSYHPRVETWKVSQKFSNSVKTFVKKNQVSMFSFWQLVFALWIFRIDRNGNGTVLVPGVVARRDSKFESVVGYFTNVIIFKYEILRLMTEYSVNDMILESHSNVIQAIENGRNFPYPILTRRVEFRSLLDTSFLWLSRVERVFSDIRLLKNKLTIASDGDDFLSKAVTNYGVHEICGVASHLLAERRLTEAREQAEWSEVGNGGKTSSVQNVIQQQKGFSVMDVSRFKGPVAVWKKRDAFLLHLVCSLSVFGIPFLPIDFHLSSAAGKLRIEVAECRVSFVDFWVDEVMSSVFARFFRIGQRSEFTVRGLCDKLYIMFTSGSTGKPKGAQVMQKNLCGWIDWFQNRILPPDSFLFQTSVAFDTFIQNVIVPILTGCSTIIVPEGQEKEVEFVLNLPVSVVSVTPSHFSALFESSCGKRLRLVIFAGENLSEVCAKNASCMSFQTLNTYGPTECADFMSCHSVDGKSKISIGRPIPKSSWILVSRMVVIQGFCVGGGYVNLLRQTRRTFLVDAQVNDGSSKCYATGDNGFFLENGEMQFNGRFDDQVKINGQRVELGSVESYVRACKHVKQCAVLVRRLENLTSLLCFFVGDADSHCILRELTKSAPRHEIPHQLIKVDAIPLTSSGKVDRSTLLSMAQAKLEPEVQKGSNSRAKFLVAKAMSQILSRSVVEKETKTFWELGGTSLMAMSLDAILQQEFGKRIGVSRMMHDGSIQGIVSFLKSLEDSSFSIKTMSRQLLLTTNSIRNKKKRRFVRSSSGQEGLFFIWKQFPSATNYTVVMTVPTIGMGKAQILSQIEHLCRKHHSLRVKGYIMCAKILLQEIEPSASHFYCKEASSECLHVAPWNLESGDGLTRFVQSQVSLALVMHHSICDEWSVRILREDFARTEHFERSFHVWEFAEWEWELQEREGELMKAWWQKHLAGCNPLGPLLFPQVTLLAKTRATRVASKIGPLLTSKITKAAKAAKSSRFAFWQGVFAFWALRNMDEPVDVLVVGPYGRRDMAQFQRTVGYLLNMVVYRYRAEALNASRDLASLARESGRVIAEAIEHGGNYPFARLIREAGVENSDRLMDVMFNWVTGQDMRFTGESRLDSKNPFTVHCDGATLAVESTVFDSMSELHNVLSGVMRVASKSGMAEESVERALQEEEWGTGPTLALGGIVPVTFQGAVRKFMKTKLDSSKLVDLSFVAGSKAGDVIGMHMRRSERLVWLTYSITLQGFAFLPLDAQYGAQVVEYRLRDSEAAVCCMDEWRGMTGEVVVAASLKFGRRGRKSVCCTNDKGYMFYTSGSTGNPKGVVINQSNVPNLCTWLQLSSFAVTCSDSLLFQGSISFDPFVEILAWCCWSSCSLAVAKDLDAVGLNCAIDVASVIDITPSHWMTVWKHKYKPKLRLLIFGGEALSEAAMGTVIGKCHVWNLFGPTECTVSMLACTQITSNRVSIGRPFSNTQVVLLETLQICGKSVGHGYKNLSERTKSAFVYDLLRSNDGASKRYDTGDETIFWDCGEMKFIGRNDDQVKISGQRVELGAVESAVLSCPGVKQCAIVVVENSAGNKSLAAFVVVDGQATDTKSIREHVARHAARHEVPHQIVVMEAIPLTTSGKADRAALKKMLHKKEQKLTSDSSLSAETLRTIEAPTASRQVVTTHVMVAQAMSHALGVQVLPDTTKTFWELGGTSLMAMTLDGALQAATGVRIGIAKMMQDGSVVGLAKFIDERRPRTTQDAESNAARPQQRQQEQQQHLNLLVHQQRSTLFARVSAGQEGLYVIWKQRPEATNYTVVFETAMLDTSKEECWEALRRLVQVHSALRTKSFMQRGKTLLQEVGCRSDEFDWRWSQISSEDEAVLWLSHESHRAWDLESGEAGGMLRARGSSDRRLRVWMHHVLGDEWSMRVMQDDMRQPGEDATSRSLQMWEFAEWEWGLLQRDGEAMSAWWREHLRGCKALRLHGMDGGSERRQNLCRRVGAKIAETLLAADDASCTSSRCVAVCGVARLFAVWALETHG